MSLRTTLWNKLWMPIPIPTFWAFSKHLHSLLIFIFSTISIQNPPSYHSTRYYPTTILSFSTLRQSELPILYFHTALPISFTFTFQHSYLYTPHFLFSLFYSPSFFLSVPLSLPSSSSSIAISTVYAIFIFYLSSLLFSILLLILSFA